MSKDANVQITYSTLERDIVHKVFSDLERAKEYYQKNLALFFMGSFGTNLNRTQLLQLSENFLHLCSVQALIQAYEEEMPVEELFLQERTRDPEGWKEIKEKVLCKEQAAVEIPYEDMDEEEEALWNLLSR